MPVRIDKYLWAVRLYKTRSLATDACRMGRIQINDSTVKPSRNIEGNEIIVVRKPPVNYTYKVLTPTENRVSPKLVINFLQDLTPDSEKIKLEIQKSLPAAFRKRGTGRPTKKERRVIDKWQDGFTEP